MDEHFDVLVSPDDNYLTHSGGAAAALWKNAELILGESQREEASQLGLSDVFVSRSGELNSLCLFHGITVDLKTNETISSY